MKYAFDSNNIAKVKLPDLLSNVLIAIFHPLSYMVMESLLGYNRLAY